MLLRQTLLVAPMLALVGCAADYPENPTPEELNEMHAIMRECLDDVVPLEDTSFSRRCQKVEDALIAYYGSLDAYLEALRARE